MNVVAAQAGCIKGCDRRALAGRELSAREDLPLVLQACLIKVVEGNADVESHLLAIDGRSRGSVKRFSRGRKQGLFWAAASSATTIRSKATTKIMWAKVFI